ncbi:MAG: helix-turn-helix domain-containing protein [Gemmatimonadaceae bacterium]|nr:helix-turn-helix domain-containing protein [Gemmatimonadaceae bacterium]
MTFEQVAVGHSRREGARLVAYLESPEERSVLQQLRPTASQLTFVATFSDLRTQLTLERSSHFVADVTPRDEQDLVLLGQTVRGIASATFVTFRVRASIGLARLLLVVADHLPSARLSLREVEPISDAAVPGGAVAANGSAYELARALLRGLTVPTVDLLALLIVAGHRRFGVDRLSQLSGIPPRTLEWRIKRDTGMTPRALIGTIHALHSLWALEVAGKSQKAVAATSGHQSTSSWSSHFRRHLGQSPGSALQNGGLSAALLRVVMQLRNVQ